MTESAEHPYVDWIVAEARRAVSTDAAAKDRIMDVVRAAEPPRHEPIGLWSRFTRPQSFTASPAQLTAIAAGLVAIVALPLALLTHRDGHTLPGQPTTVAVTSRLPASDTVVKFVFVAPQATTVSLVGDFNDWSSRATPMRRAQNGGVWSVTLPLGVGRHLYAFMVNGTEWIADPQAPLAPDDGFGHANSVVLVTGRSSL